MRLLKRYFFYKRTPHGGHPSSSFVAFPCHFLCSIVSRRHQKNTKLLKTNTKSCNNYTSKVQIEV